MRGCGIDHVGEMGKKEVKPDPNFPQIRGLGRAQYSKELTNMPSQVRVQRIARRRQ